MPSAAPTCSLQTATNRLRLRTGQSAEARDTEAVPDERVEAVLRALQTLSPRQQEILLLRWRHQLTYEQIGAKLGIAPGTVSAHIQRARGQLRQALSK